MEDELDYVYYYGLEDGPISETENMDIEIILVEDAVDDMPRL